MSNLYKLTQTVYTDYDTYSDCVVCANSEEEAKYIHPSGKSGQDWILNDLGVYSEWAIPEDVTATLIGTAAEGIEVGSVICASFHAG